MWKLFCYLFCFDVTRGVLSNTATAGNRDVSAAPQSYPKNLISYNLTDFTYLFLKSFSCLANCFSSLLPFESSDSIVVDKPTICLGSKFKLYV